MIASRRNSLFAGASFLAAPSIVRVASLMPVSVLRDLPCIETPVAFAPSAGVGSMYMSTDGGFYVLAADGWTAPWAFTDKIVDLYDEGLPNALS